ncbi:MAG: hypothetical protein RLZZ347_715 [Candidatus Parcubacteria bacterium]|jgi:O-6-methylguanine DNA methyltransferase
MNISHSKNSFREKVLAFVKTIPEGSVATYGYVAKQAGKLKASRAVGAILKTNFDPSIPCHRVIRSDGSLGGYNRGAIQKRARLKKEGAIV